MKNKVISEVTLLIAFVLAASGPVFAHHGNAAYDLTHPLTLRGTVTKFVWENPHAQLYLNVTDSGKYDGEWALETLSPSALHRAGWAHDSVKPGDDVTVVLLPAKSGAHVGHFHELIFSDGRKLDVGEECIYCPANPHFLNGKGPVKKP